MNPALVVAIIALAVSIAALTWQVVSFLYSGSRAKVEIANNDPLRRHVNMADPLQVTVRNVGRVPVQVVLLGLQADNARLHYEGPFGLILPTTIDPGHHKVWTLQADLIEPTPKPLREGIRIRAWAVTGTGRRAMSSRGTSITVA
jgi:hypothetical protein